MQGEEAQAAEALQSFILHFGKQQEHPAVARAAPGHNGGRVWPQPAGNICVYAGDDGRSQVNGRAEAAAGVAVHSAADPVARLQDHRLNATALHASATTGDIRNIR